MAAGVFEHLLLATEHSEHDRGAEALALALAARCGVPLAVVMPVPGNPEFEMVAPERAARADAEVATRREALVADAAVAGVQAEVHVRRGIEPWQEIVDEARERGADLIVIRRRGRRGLLANLLVGEMVSQVVSNAPCSVVVTAVEARMWQRRVLVALDPAGQEAAGAATVALAAAVARACGLPLHVLAVVGQEQTRAAAEQAVAKARASCAGVTTTTGEVRLGTPHAEILAAATEHGADLLVVARHGGNAAARARIGSVAHKVIGLATCPVLVHVPVPPAAPGPRRPRGEPR